jgi:hypothetical protein
MDDARCALHLARKSPSHADILAADPPVNGTARSGRRALGALKEATFVTKLPCCILAVYDLFRGITRQVWFEGD